MSQEQVKQNKMGTMPINKLLLSMALPMMASMLVQALYNIVDTIFVAQLGEDAISALSYAFPVQNFMIAIGSGTGVGINAYLSRSLGEHNINQANKVAKNGLFLCAISSLVFVIFGLFFSEIYMKTQTQNDTIIQYGADYLSVCTIFAVCLFGQMTFERLLQSTGKTFYTMITQGLGAIINIILDPILIFGWFGFPELGVKGAALATIIGQACALIIALFFNLKKNKELSINFKKFKPSVSTIKTIYSVGIPSILMMSIASVMLFFMNKILGGFSETSVAVLGVYFKLQSFIFMPVFGLNNGMIPIVAYNYGAANRKRITKTIKLAIVYAVSIMIIGFIIFQTCPTLLLKLFESTPEMDAIGETALRTISLSFIPAGFCIILVSVFQAFGKGFISLLISVIRQLAVLLPAAYLLSLICVGNDVSPIWFSFPIAEISSVILCIIFIRKIYNTIIKPLDNVKN